MKLNGVDTNNIVQYQDLHDVLFSIGALLNQGNMIVPPTRYDVRAALHSAAGKLRERYEARYKSSVDVINFGDWVLVATGDTLTISKVNHDPLFQSSEEKITLTQDKILIGNAISDHIEIVS